jgi:hypothetical protein
MNAFDFSATAELYPSRAKGSRRQPIGYKRFECAAEAIRFAIEELPAESLVGAFLEVGEERFNGQEIQQLYQRPDYPLQRHENSAQRRQAISQDAARVIDLAPGAARKKRSRSARQS